MTATAEQQRGDFFFFLVLQYSTENALGVSHLSLNPWQLRSVLLALLLCLVMNRQQQKFWQPCSPFATVELKQGQYGQAANLSLPKNSKVFGQKSRCVLSPVRHLGA